MDILFENSYIRNKKLAKEIYRYYYFKRKIYIFSYVMLGFFFTKNLLSAIFLNSYSLIVFIVAPLCALVPVYCYICQVNAMIQRDNEIHGKEIEVNTVVTDEFIQSTSSTGGVSKVEFDKIKTAIQTKNLILLHSKANLIYIFAKDAFNIGGKEEFVTFLKTKGIKVIGK